MASGVTEQMAIFAEASDRGGSASIELIRRMAAHFDAQGRRDQHIDVNLTRGWLIRHFKPARRGGRIMCGNHELRAFGEAVIEREPKPRKRRTKAPRE